MELHPVRHREETPGYFKGKGETGVFKCAAVLYLRAITLIIYFVSGALVLLNVACH